jgi:iron complex transport system substrate-binding protein
MRDHFDAVRDTRCRRRPGRDARVLRTLAAWLLAATSVAALPQARPGRIVSTSPSITEALFALGLGDRVVGVSRFCRYPAAVAALPKVGTFLEPNPETIARLKPDMVFVHPGPNAAASQLATLGIHTAVVDPGSLASVFATIRQIGGAAGVPDRAERLVADLDAGLARVRTSAAKRPPRRVLIIVGRRTGTLSDIVAVGPGSYLHDIAGIAGGTNVLAGVALEYPRISMETVISLAPDVIIDVGEMGESPADSDKRRRITERLWQRQTLVRAVREGRVHAVHDEAFVVPGPRVVEVAKAMATWFHGVDVQ